MSPRPGDTDDTGGCRDNATQLSEWLNVRPRLSLSVVLPVHNEEAILEQNVLALERHLDSLEQLDAFEVLLVCNGCSDASERVSARLAGRVNGHVRMLCLDARGLGRAIRAGIDAAAYDFIMFYAVDLPFGLEVFDRSIDAALANRNRVVIGSKGHAASHVPRHLSRRVFSSLASLLNNVMFAVDVKDTQGSLLFPKAIVARYGTAMDNPGAFFQAQVVIYGHLMGCELLEIPVRLYASGEQRKTRFKLIGDGARYVAAIVREKYRLMTAAAPRRNGRS
jgi:glycosyltransferase involved in cell wall biosynthesis